MAMSPKKHSSSSSTIASRANPNSRNSEINNPMRRSFGGNPFTKPSIVANPRSFNPVTPANSPSDYSRRNSIGRQNPVSLLDHEDKENGKDLNLKPGRVRSPSLSKSSKNFMSPTISAASKITALPRKKILVERNESAMTSVSFSEGKSPCVEDSDTKTEMDLSRKNHLEASNDSTVTDMDSLGDPLASKDSKNEEVFHSKASPSNFKNDSESLSENFNVDVSSKISPSPLYSSPILAPLDADPSMPPYDPKTNYLSPRPQFLHYRPNPRIELYLNKESKQLEESFISEIFPDTEGTEDTESEISQKESEDVSSVEMVKEEEEEEELHVSEPSPITTDMPEETVEANEVSKLSFITRSKFIALILVLVIGCLSVSVTDSPVIDHSAFKDLSFSMLYVPPEITEVAKANFEWLAQNVQQWSADSLSYLSKLIPPLMKAHKLGPLQYYNLTALREDFSVDGYLMFDHSDRGSGEKFEPSLLGPITEENVEIKVLDEKGQLEIEPDENSKDASEEDSPAEYGEEEHPVIETTDDIEVVLERHSKEFDEVNLTQAEVIEPDSSEAEQSQEEVDLAVHIDSEPQSNVDLLEESIPASEAPDIQPDVSEAREFQGEIDMTSCAQAEVIEPDSSEAEQSQEEVDRAVHIDTETQSNIDLLEATIPALEAHDIQPDVSEAREFQGENDMSCAQIEYNEAELKADTLPEAEVIPESPELDALTDKSQSSESVDVMPNELEFSTRNVLGISILVLTLIAATVFFYVKKEKSPALNVAIPTGHQLVTKKKFDISPKTASAELYFYDRPSSRNWPTEVDMVGESCPSEMSSFQRSSSYSKKGLKGSNEAQSHERKPRKNYRRESLDSSDYSMGSYGSFTTYEKIPGKHGGEEEMITPVRRSSRLRNQVTSP